MQFHGLIDYARRRGLTFERIALREITLSKPAKGFTYRATFVLIDGGFWADRDCLAYRGD